MRDGCPFCDYEGPSPLLFENRWVYGIEPMDPVTLGHTLVIPKAHVQGFEEVAVMMDVMQAVALMAGRGPANVIVSVGKESTQTIPHLHFHVVPRRHGDGLTIPWGKLAEDHAPKPQPGTPEYEAREARDRAWAERYAAEGAS